MKKVITIAGCILVVAAHGQTRIDLSRQSKAPDFSALTQTRPIQVGASLPSSCIVGELFFDSSATSGQNLNGCVAPGVWSQISGSGGGAGLGQCRVDPANNVDLICPGDFVSGDGTVAGEIVLYSLAANGSRFASWLVPDTMTSSYRLRLPADPPADGQLMSFAAPINGIATVAWITPKRQQVFSAALGAGSTWVPGPGWSVPNDANAATPTALAGRPYLSFPGAVMRRASLQTALASDWTGSATLNLVWSANNAAIGSTINIDVAAACTADGQSLSAPVFNAAQSKALTVPYTLDASAKRTTTTFDALDLTGCAPGHTLTLLISHDGSRDTGSTEMQLWSVALVTSAGMFQ